MGKNWHCVAWMEHNIHCMEAPKTYNISPCFYHHIPTQLVKTERRIVPLIYLTSLQWYSLKCTLLAQYEWSVLVMLLVTPSTEIWVSAILPVLKAFFLFMSDSICSSYTVWRILVCLNMKIFELKTILFPLPLPVIINRQNDPQIKVVVISPYLWVFHNLVVFFDLFSILLLTPSSQGRFACCCVSKCCVQGVQIQHSACCWKLSLLWHRIQIVIWKLDMMDDHW